MNFSGILPVVDVTSVVVWEVFALNGSGSEQQGSDEGRIGGVVKWFDDAKGYGFIVCSGHGEVFVHYNDIEMKGRRILVKGQIVELTVVNTPEGKQARQVVPIPLVKATVSPERDERFEGIVKRFNDEKGYGFISCEAKDDVFVHFGDIQMDEPKALNVGQKVAYNIVPGKRGLKAVNVVVLDSAPPPNRGDGGRMPGPKQRPTDERIDPVGEGPEPERLR